MNFIAGQWKDGLSFHLPDEKRQKVIHFGVEGVLKKEERTTPLVNYDGAKLVLFQDGRAIKLRETGPLIFGGWSMEYPLVFGTDAGGKAQWKGVLYEVAIYDRALTSQEVLRLSGREEKKGTRDEGIGTGKRDEGRWRRDEAKTERSSSKEGARDEERQGRSQPIADSRQKTADRRLLVHYVFRQENTYETEFRGKRAIGVRDLGKGEPADLVIPEYFEPYERAFLKWDPEWMQYRTNWLDVIVNIVGFVPLGALLIFAAAKIKCLNVCPQGTRDEGVGTERRDEGRGCRDEAKTERSSSKEGARDAERQGFGTKEGLQDSGFRLRDQYKTAIVVGLAVVVGFGVSFVIEYLQAYLPSRDSSLRDLVTNVIGTMIGAGAGALIMRKREAEIVSE